MDSVKKVVDEEIALLPERFKERRKIDYVCYCLRSVTARARTYFGTTHDLVHRLRQHNGIIKGGARATMTSRPWRVAIVIYGFSSRSAALRYEWFCKMKHSQAAYTDALQKGANSIERRVALMTRAKQMCPKEELQYYFGDTYFEQCCATSTSEEQDKQICYVSM
ncbi:MAG: GIY-YIG nuclease family protein [Desulfosporosinus sp.]|nr:GIY-YIG nuclease family protein [Desulfosporosinus sp.]